LRYNVSDPPFHEAPEREPGLTRLAGQILCLAWQNIAKFVEYFSHVVTEKDPEVSAGNADLRKSGVMSKVWQVVKHELLELIGPAVFFFVTFNVIAFSKKLFLEGYHINFTGFFLTASIGALLVAKVVLIADEIPLINRFPRTPLVTNVIWKSVIYSVVALLVQFLEELVPRLWHHLNLAAAATAVWREIHWPHFWAVHILLTYFLLIYVSFRELARTFGEVQFFQLFFGFPRTASSDKSEAKNA
jgi:hypothetical protein